MDHEGSPHLGFKYYQQCTCDSPNDTSSLEPPACTSNCSWRCVRMLSHVRPFATPRTAARQVFCPWDSPGKITGGGCHFLLQGIFLTQDHAHILCASSTGRHVLYQLHPLEAQQAQPLPNLSACSPSLASCCKANLGPNTETRTPISQK